MAIPRRRRPAAADDCGGGRSLRHAQGGLFDTLRMTTVEERFARGCFPVVSMTARRVANWRCSSGVAGTRLRSTERFLDKLEMTMGGIGKSKTGWLAPADARRAPYIAKCRAGCYLRNRAPLPGLGEGLG